MNAKLVQQSKVLSQISVTAGSDIDVKLVQLSKAPSQILVTAGSVVDVKLVQPWNAW